MKTITYDEAEVLAKQVLAELMEGYPSATVMCAKEGLNYGAYNKLVSPQVKTVLPNLVATILERKYSVTMFKTYLYEIQKQQVSGSPQGVDKEIFTGVHTISQNDADILAKEILKEYLDSMSQSEMATFFGINIHSLQKVLSVEVPLKIPTTVEKIISKQYNILSAQKTHIYILDDANKT